LVRRLSADFNEQSDGYFFLKSLDFDTDDETRWDEAADWLHEQTNLYEAVLREIVPAMEGAS
jgi:hypothetical protein